MILKKLNTFFISFFLLLFSARNVFGSAGKTEIEWPNSPFSNLDLSKNSEFHDFIAYLYEWGIQIGLLVAFAMFIIAGLQFLSAGGSPGLRQNAMKRISSALIGTGLLFSTWLILNTINPHLTHLTPIPPLFELINYNIEEVEDPLDVDPCEFVILYEKTDFEGDNSRKDVGIPNEEKLNYMSAIGFRAMNTFEKNVYDNNKDHPYFSERHLVFYGSSYPYIDGGPCSVNIYTEDGRAWSKNKCGKLLGSISLPSRNFELGTKLEESEDTLDCYIIVDTSRNKDRKTESRPSDDPQYNPRANPSAR